MRPGEAQDCSLLCEKIQKQIEKACVGPRRHASGMKYDSAPPYVDGHKEPGGGFQVRDAGRDGQSLSWLGASRCRTAGAWKLASAVRKKEFCASMEASEAPLYRWDGLPERGRNMAVEVRTAIRACRGGMRCARRSGLFLTTMLCGFRAVGACVARRRGPVDRRTILRRRGPWPAYRHVQDSARPCQCSASPRLQGSP